MLYVGCEDGYLYALNLRQGALQWRHHCGGGVTSSPILWNGLLIVGSTDRHVYALDVNSGWPVWRFRAEKAIISSPRIHEETVYIGSADHLPVCPGSHRRAPALEIRDGGSGEFFAGCWPRCGVRRIGRRVGVCYRCAVGQETLEVRDPRRRWFPLLYCTRTRFTSARSMAGCMRCRVETPALAI